MSEPSQGMERTAPLGLAADETPSPGSLAPNTLDLFAQVTAELDRADALASDERRDLGDSLNRRLLALPRNGGRPVADALLRLLDGKRLGTVIDSEGRSARAAAVEALLGLGYPYALELAPEDLEHLRQGGGFKTPAFSMVSALVMVGAMAALEAAGSAGDALPLIHAGLTVASAIAVAATRPLSLARRWATISLLIAGVEGVLLAVFGASLAALPSGLAALIAAAWMSKKR